jgi:hypothetical protein
MSRPVYSYIVTKIVIFITAENWCLISAMGGEETWRLLSLCFHKNDECCYFGLLTGSDEQRRIFKGFECSSRNKNCGNLKTVSVTEL